MSLILSIVLSMLLSLFKCDNTPSIVFLAPPTRSDLYYVGMRDELFDYYSNFINVFNTNNNNNSQYILAIVDNYGKEQLLNRGVPLSNIFLNEIGYELQDIWIRDFGTVQVDDTLYKFIYKPDYLAPSSAELIDKYFMLFLEVNKIKYTNISIILDGGNFVFERNTKKLITTSRILKDNPQFNETQLINYLKTNMNINQICIIPEEGDEETGHADGMVTFINNNIIGVNNYTKYGNLGNYTQLYNTIINDLYNSFGNNINIIDLPFDPSAQMWRTFASAKGIYTNILTGLYDYYSPLYDEKNGDDEKNINILNEYKANNVKVIGIDSSQVCIMGGSVRCLSWYIWGQPAINFIQNHNLKKM